MKNQNTDETDLKICDYLRFLKGIRVIRVPKNKSGQFSYNNIKNKQHPILCQQLHLPPPI